MMLYEQDLLKARQEFILVSSKVVPITTVHIYSVPITRKFLSYLLFVPYNVDRFEAFCKLLVTRQKDGPLI
ncbi:unnamed protein product [Haemonchus placei]|uniref:Ovule protein n=1 Tax=Haemonchus placei TaxID=6290 RepID=A0A0N4WU80_HAEPC|nr:unnamed protein product [Haemonchus placei]